MNDSDFFPPAPRAFPTGERELRFSALLFILCLLLADCLIYGGLNLGFSLCSAAVLLASAEYLRSTGRKIGSYPAALLTLCVIISLSFIRSNDYFVEFVMVCFLIATENLALCLIAGKNKWPSGSFSTLADSLRTIFCFGLKKVTPAAAGLRAAQASGSPARKKRVAILCGLAAGLPLGAVLICLLKNADAAFEALLEKLPSPPLGEYFWAIVVGAVLWCVLYARSVALCYDDAPTPSPRERKTRDPMAVNTLLTVVCGIYTLFLFSQLSYFLGGFSGTLPENLTPAVYARRGFFEMAVLCAINLTVFGFSLRLTKPRDASAPPFTRILCLALCLMTLFFVAAASGKMVLYIRYFGMTRLRVLTEVIMLFLGISTAVCCLWLFVPRLPYMRTVILAGLILGAATAWADVDTLVAAYNVRAYQAGRLGSVDVAYLSTLSSGAVPYLRELSRDPNPQVADQAGAALSVRVAYRSDLRAWNLTAGAASQSVTESQIRIVIRLDTEDEVYQLEKENRLKGVTVSSAGVCNADASPLKGELCFVLTARDFPTGTAVPEGYSFCLSLSDGPGREALTATTDFCQPFTPEYGKTYVFTVTGNFRDGFTLKEGRSDFPV